MHKISFLIYFFWAAKKQRKEWRSCILRHNGYEILRANERHKPTDSTKPTYCKQDKIEKKERSHLDIYWSTEKQKHKENLKSNYRKKDYLKKSDSWNVS